MFPSIETTEQTVPFFGNVIQDFGKSKRIIKGEGIFFGKSCDKDLNLLKEAFEEKGSGILRIPNFSPFLASFKSLNVKREAGSSAINYTFEFWEKSEEYTEEPSLIKPAAQEKPEAGGGGQRKEYTVVSGDTLWAVAKRNGIGLTELISLNPQIKNPNRIYPGDKIYLS